MEIKAKVKNLQHLFSVKIIHNPVSIGLIIAIIFSTISIMFISLQVDRDKSMMIASEFTEKNSGLRWISAADFRWQLFPYPQLSILGIKLETADGSCYIDIGKGSIRISASDLLHRKIHVKEVSMDDISVRINKSFDALINIGSNLNRKKSSNFNSNSDINFVFDPNTIYISGIKLSYIGQSASGNYSILGGEVTLYKIKDSIQISKESHIKSNFDMVIHGIKFKSDNEWDQVWDLNQGTIGIKTLLSKSIAKENENISIDISGDIEYDYMHNFFQGTGKTNIKDIQSLANKLNMYIPETINNTKFDNLSTSGIFVFKSGAYVMKNLHVNLGDFGLHGKLEYHSKNKKLDLDIECEDFRLDELHTTTEGLLASKETGYLNHANKLLHLIRYQNINLKFNAKKFQINQYFFVSPLLELKKSATNYTVNYETDIETGKLGISLEFQYPAQRLEVKVNSSLVSFSFANLCANANICKKAKGKIDFMSNFILSVHDRHNFRINGTAETDMEEFSIPNLDIEFVYKKFLALLNEKKLESAAIIPSTSFTKFKSSLKMDGNIADFYKIDATTKNHTVKGSGKFYPKNMQALINFTIKPKNYYYYQSNNYSSEFYDMELPVICSFQNNSWLCTPDKHKLQKILNKKGIAKEAQEKLLKLSLHEK